MIDARMGKPLTTGSAEAAEKYQLAVDCILGSETGAAEMLGHTQARQLRRRLHPAGPSGRSPDRIIHH